MYLLVFVTLVISLIGLYAQVLTLQSARLAQGQTVVAQAMLRWHSTAISEARYTQITPTPGATGCDLTSPGILGAVCHGARGSSNVSITPPAGWAGFTCSNPLTPPCYTQLPAGYATNTYTFYSIYYIPAGGTQSYVITFIPKPAAANPGFITLPGIGGNPISITMGDLANQLRNSGLNPLFYGTVQGGQLRAQSIQKAAGGPFIPLNYTTPPAVTNGSIAIISAP
jgi:hypothetical protein